MAENLTARKAKGRLKRAVLGLGEMLDNLENEGGIFPEVREAFFDAMRRQEEVFEDPRSRSNEADRFRHIAGAREAALRAGPIPAFLGSTGHEVVNLLQFLGGKEQGTGMEDMSLREALSESARDFANNLVGIHSAMINPNTLTPEEEEALLSRGFLRPAEEFAPAPTPSPGAPLNPKKRRLSPTDQAVLDALIARGAP